MPRPPLPLRTYGKIKTCRGGAGWLARAQFRDHDGIVRHVKRSGKSRAAAERALRAALVDRQAPVKQAAVTPAEFAAVAELWLAEVERAVDEGGKSPGTLDVCRSIHRRHVKPALGALRVREVDTPVVDRMLATGCRIGECLAIGWDEVDLDGAAVDVCWRLVRRTGVGLLRLPSTKSGKRRERLIPLPELGHDDAQTSPARDRLGVQPVFPDSLGGWRDPSNVRRV